VYRTHSWLAPLTVTRLRGWQLADAEDRLARAQGRLLLTGSQFSLSAPFTALDEARAELDRLQRAGARMRHRVLFLAAESGWLCAAALSVGAAAGIGAATLLASSQGEPAGAIPAHSPSTPAGMIALATGWLSATALLAALAGVRSARLIDTLAVAAVSALVAALVGGT